MADTTAIIGAIENAARAKDKAAVLTLSGHLDSQIDDKEREILRAKNTAFGAFLRDQATQPIEGESEEDRSRRLYGSLSADDEESWLMPRLRSAFAGQTMELGDEIVAGGAALANLLTGKDPGKSFTELYPMYLNRERPKARQFMEEHPGEDILFKVGGAVVSPLWRVLGRLGAAALAPFPRARSILGVATPTSILGAAREGAKVGAYGGAAYGFGMGEEGLGDRASSAAEMTVYGAGGGAVLGVGVRAVIGLIKNGLTWNQARKQGIPRAVYDEAAAISAADEAVTGGGAVRIARMGDDAMLADSGRGAAARLDQIIATGGPGAAQAQRAVVERGERVGAELVKELDAVLGPLRGVQTRHQIRYGKEDPGALYEAAYATPINYAGESGIYLLGLLQRLPKGAFDAANELIRTDARLMGKRVGQIIAKIDDADGTLTFEKLPDLRQIDYVTRVLGDLPNTTRPVEGSILPETTQFGRNIFDLGQRIRQVLKDQVPEYREALKIASMNMDARSGTRLGAEMLNPRTTRQDFFTAIESLGQRELDFVKQGLRSHIDDVMARVERAMGDPITEENAMKEIVRVVRGLSSRGSRDKMRNLLGDEAEQIFQRLGKVEQSIQLQARLRDQSLTYARQAAEGRGAAYGESALNTLLSGRLMEGAGQMLRGAFGADPASRLASQQASNAALAQVLTQRLPRQYSTVSSAPSHLEELYRMQAAQFPKRIAQTDRSMAATTQALNPLRLIGGVGAAELRSAENEQQRQRIAAALRN